MSQLVHSVQNSLNSNNHQFLTIQDCCSTEAKSEEIKLEPGDAICVYGGREKWNEVNPTWGSDPAGRPGLHASCLKFLRESDCYLLVWDMMDFALMDTIWDGQCTALFLPTAWASRQRFIAAIIRSLF